MLGNETERRIDTARDVLVGKLPDPNRSQKFFDDIILNAPVGAGSKPACFVQNMNTCGNIVNFTWNDLPNHIPGIELDEFVVMPNHVHGIIRIIRSDSQGANLEHTNSQRANSQRAGLEPAPTIGEQND